MTMYIEMSYMMDKRCTVKNNKLKVKGEPKL